MNITSKQLFSHFKNIIPMKNLNKLAHDAKRVRIFDPLLTLRCFLHQVITSSSCRETLAFLNCERIQKGDKTISICSSAFTRAKSKLCENKLLAMVLKTGRQISEDSKKWKWMGRDVYFADGTIIQMFDSNKNRAEYPRSKFKGVEVSFPKLRLLGLFCASSGAFIDGEIAKYSGKGQGEPSLLLKLLDRIQRGSVLVLDRFFTSLELQSILQNYEIEYVIRSREQFAKKILGRKHDKTVTMKMRAIRKDSIYLGMVNTNKITFRVLKSKIKNKGYRDKAIYIITSMFDVDKKEIEKIYLGRWNVELDIRSLKVTMESDQLKSKSPEMVRKELWVRLLGYNLVRNLMVKSSFYSDGPPRKRSFKLSLKLFPELIRMKGGTKIINFLELIASINLNSKYRREPRAIKRRRNSYPLLTTSREEAKKQHWGYRRRRPLTGPSTEYGALNAVA